MSDDAKKIGKLFAKAHISSRLQAIIMRFKNLSDDEIREILEEVIEKNLPRQKNDHN